jgi:hypothetical protein
MEKRQSYGQRPAIGIKPPRLLQQVDVGLRQSIFVQREVDDWVGHNACHELVHACGDDLQLPTWLHEGLAMVTVDRFAGRATVKAETRARWPATRRRPGPPIGRGWSTWPCAATGSRATWPRRTRPC